MVITCLLDDTIGDAEPLKRSTFITRGSTALLDAIEIDETPKTIVIITDGVENASKMTILVRNLVGIL